MVIAGLLRGRLTGHWVMRLLFARLGCLGLPVLDFLLGVLWFICFAVV